MSTEPTALVVHQPMHVEAFHPIMGVAGAIERYNAILEFTQQIMKPGKDYGTVPGIDKPSLLKPGAEKLCSFFGFTPKFTIIEKVEQWDGAEPFFFYFYKCSIYRGDYLIAEGDGSCNSKESKYRYRWVQENQLPAGADVKRFEARGGRTFEFDFAINRAETSGKYGKPESYWNAFKKAIEESTATRTQKDTKKGPSPGWEIDTTVYRVPNPDVCDQVNTIQKMAQKRALVAATLIACNASEYYTQDVEEMDSIVMPTTAPTPQQEPTGGPVSGESGPSGPQAAGAPPASARPAINRTVPEELQLVFKDISGKVTGAVSTAFKFLEGELVAEYSKVGEGKKGLEIYNRTVTEWRTAHPGDKAKDISEIKECLLDLWDALTVIRDTNSMKDEGVPTVEEMQQGKLGE